MCVPLKKKIMIYEWGWKNLLKIILLVRFFIMMLYSSNIGKFSNGYNNITFHPKQWTSWHFHRIREKPHIRANWKFILIKVGGKKNVWNENLYRINFVINHEAIRSFPVSYFFALHNSRIFILLLRKWFSFCLNS